MLGALETRHEIATSLAPEKCHENATRKSCCTNCYPEPPLEKLTADRPGSPENCVELAMNLAPYVTKFPQASRRKKCCEITNQNSPNHRNVGREGAGDMPERPARTPEAPKR